MGHPVPLFPRLQNGETWDTRYPKSPTNGETEYPVPGPLKPTQGLNGAPAGPTQDNTEWGTRRTPADPERLVKWGTGPADWGGLG